MTRAERARLDRAEREFMKTFSDEHRRLLDRSHVVLCPLTAEPGQVIIRGDGFLRDVIETQENRRLVVTTFPVPTHETAEALRQVLAQRPPPPIPT